MINVICARQGGGKTTNIMELIKQIPKNEQAFLIVPEQSTYENERMLFDRLAVNGLMNVQVMSLQRLAYRVAETTPLKNKTILTQEGKGLILKHVIDETMPSLKIFRGVSEKVGFLDQMMEFIDELKKNTVQTEDILHLCETEKDGTLQEKLTDIHKIYTRYNDILSRDYIDQQDYLIACAQYVKNNDALKGSHFFFDDFHSFDNAAYPLLEALMKSAASCYFTLTYDDDDLFFVTSDTFRKLKQTAENAGRPFERIILTGKHSSPDDLVFLEKSLMDLDDVFYAGSDNSVRLHKADTIDSETERVAAEIDRLIREETYRYYDIAVIVSDLDKYAPVIEDVFDRHNIPYFIDQRKPIIFSSPVKAFLFLISMLERNISGSEIIAFAKTGFSDITDEEIMLIENYASEFGIKGGMWQKDFTRNNYEESYDLTYINEIRVRLMAPILEMKRIMHPYENTKEFCANLYRFLDEWGFRERIDSYVAAFADNSDYELSNAYAQIYNKILTVIEQTYDFFGEDDSIEPKQFHQMLTYAFISSNIGIIPATPDRINIGDIKRSRAGNVKALFMLGANEGMFPSESRDAGILSEDEKLRIQDKGIELVQTAGYNRKKELFLIYTLLTKPSEYLYLSRFIYDRAGDEYEPSFLFERVCTLFPSLSVQTDTIQTFEDETKLITDKGSALSRLTANLSDRKYTEEHDPKSDRLYDDIYLFFKTHDPLRLKMLEEGLSFTNTEKITDMRTYREAVNVPLSLSISRLEKYAACPFSFFAQYLLHPEPRREHAVYNTDIGTVLHAVVERYSQMILQKEIEIDVITDAEADKITNAIAQEVLSEHASGLFSQIVQSRYLTAKLLRAASSAVREITRQLKRSDFLLSETEARFRFDGTLQPICVSIEGYGDVYIQGIIDRIDTYESDGKKYVKIIDYKTGSRDFDLTKAYYGLSLQLPVYMQACTDTENKVDAAGVFYFKIRPPMIKIDKETDGATIKSLIQQHFALKGITLNNLSIIRAMDNEADDSSFIGNVTINKNGNLRKNDSLIDAETFRALLDKTNTHIKDLSKRILDADISITPYYYDHKEIPCTWCDFKSLCKFSEEFGSNCYRSVRKRKADEIYEQLRNEYTAGQEGSE